MAMHEPGGPEALAARVVELAKLTATESPVISVYLDTRWRDEHQRDRVRVFLKNHLREAREGWTGKWLLSDLDWIEAEGHRLVEQERNADATGVALFACGALGLRETIPLRVPFEPAFVVADAPYLLPLAATVEEVPAALLLFVDAESARLIPLGPDGPGAEVMLSSDVPGHHRRGGWAQLAQSRYQRHIQNHRDRHFEAVVDSLASMVDDHGVERIVLAGDSRNVELFRKVLPAGLVERIAGHVAGTRHDPPSVLLERAAGFLNMRVRLDEMQAVDGVLTRAAKGDRAVAGVTGALEAANRGAVHRLYLLGSFRPVGRMCGACGALSPGPEGPCPGCGGATRTMSLSVGMINRVIASGGGVEVLRFHPALERAGGVAAVLRYGP
jgi:peptide subunit release factor 1 (eRF1)